MSRSFVFLLFMVTVSCSGAEKICVRHVIVPGYPRLARTARLQGLVRIDVGIGADGKVTSAKASGINKFLDRAAEENIRRWSFSPAAATGSSVPRHTIVTYVYRLDGKQEYYDPPPTVVLDLPYRVEITSNPPEPQPASTITPK